jgi:hypothetical protein
MGIPTNDISIVILFDKALNMGLVQNLRLTGQAL